MTRQSISFTEPNNKWLNVQIQSNEYNSKSELVNDLIRKARTKEDELNLIRAKLIQAEKSDFTHQGQKEMLAEFKKELNIEQSLSNQS